MKKHQRYLKPLNHRGDVSMALIAIVLAVAGLLVSAPIAYRFVAGSEERTQEKVCENSVAMRARTQVDVASGTATTNILPLLCRTQEKYITGNREEIKDQVARHMASCWQMFGAGRYDEILHGFSTNLFPKIENKCFVCYTLIIDQDDIEGGSITSNELMDHLLNTKYPKGDDIYYIDFLQSGGRGMAAYLVLDNEGMPASIDARHGYGISIAPKLKELSDSQFWSNILLGTGTAAAGSLVIAAIGLGTGPPGWIALAAATVVGGVVGGSATMTVWNIVAQFKGERVVSSIWLESYNDAIDPEDGCYVGDLAALTQE